MRRHHGGRIHGGPRAAAIIDSQWNIQGGQGALTECTNEDAATTMANGHPKSGIPEVAYRPGVGLDQSNAKPVRPGIGVGGALPIGSFIS